MTNVKRYKIQAMLLALVLLLSAASVFPVTAYAVTQEEIDALKEERDALAAKREEQQEVVDILTAEQADIMAQKSALDERNETTMEAIRVLEQEITLYREIIAQKEQDVFAAKEAENAQLELYRARVRAMEEMGGFNILGIILQSGDLSEFIGALDDIGMIMENDRAVEDAYIAAREHTEAVKAEYDAAYDLLQEELSELEAQKAQLDADMAEADALIAQYSEYIAANQEKLEWFEALENEANAEINSLIARLEAERRAAQQQAAQEAAAAGSVSATVSGGGVTGSGSFAWPVGCTYITSCVGNRYHPITGAWKYHSGMDIGACYGDTVWASDSGTVSLAGENGGYGLCVMIDHGNGYYTLYGHLSSIAVSQGQGVGRGQTIGYVGSTGVSTGAHLHFEIREGTTCLDFASWFSGLTYAPDSGG